MVVTWLSADENLLASDFAEAKVIGAISEGEIEPENPEPKLAALEIKSELLLDGADHRMVVSMVEEPNLSEDDSAVLPEVAPEERAVFLSNLSAIPSEGVAKKWFSFRRLSMNIRIVMCNGG